MNATLCMTDVVKHQVEFVLTRHDQSDIIMWVEGDANSLHLTHYQRVARLCPSYQRHQQE